MAVNLEQTIRNPLPVAETRVHQVSFRPRTQDDVAALADLYNRLSSKTKYLRFAKGCSPHLSESAFERWLKIYHRPPKTCSLVAEYEGLLIAETTFVADETFSKAEVGIVVEDEFQRKGVGYKMLTLLAWIAWQEGIRYFDGDILSENLPMLNFLRKTGCPMTFKRENNLVHFTMDLEYLAKSPDKEAVSTQEVLYGGRRNIKKECLRDPDQGLDDT